MEGIASTHELWINVPHVYPIISKEKPEQIEKENGLTLSLFLKKTYSEIGNGGQTFVTSIMGIACNDEPRLDPTGKETPGDEDDSLDYYEWLSKIK